VIVNIADAMILFAHRQANAVVRIEALDGIGCEMQSISCQA